MLQFCSLYSGSSGNSLFVKSNDTKILIDAGVSGKKISLALEQIGSNINEISAILVTHEHKDHVLSLATLSKKYNIPVYANEKTWKALDFSSFNYSNVKVFTPNENFFVGDLTILPFRVSHDAADPCGFNVFSDNKKISIATDLGYIDDKIMNALKDSSFVLLESNYDPKVLQCCSYPSTVKNRIAGPSGHLSNDTAAKTIIHLSNFGLKNVMLGHLSKESNFPELAYQTVLNELYSNNISQKKLNLSVASRIEPSEIINII